MEVFGETSGRSNNKRDLLEKSWRSVGEGLEKWSRSTGEVEESPERTENNHLVKVLHLLQSNAPPFS